VGKGGRCVRLTTYYHPVPLSRNLGALTSWNPLGLSRPVMGLLYLFLPQWLNCESTAIALYSWYISCWKLVDLILAVGTFFLSF